MKKSKFKPTNFLNHFNRKKRNYRKSKNYIVICATILLAVIVLFIYSYGPAKDVYQQSMNAKEKLNLAQDSLNKEDFSLAKDYLVESNNSLKAAGQSLKKIGFLKFIPIISQQYQAISVILVSGMDIADSLEGVISLVIDIFEPIKKDARINLSTISDEQKINILKKLSESENIFIEAEKSINEADSTLRAFSDKGLIGPIREVIVTFKKEIPTLKTAINEASAFARLLPPITGYPDLKTYLFLLENNTELRPAGGFIGTYGILKVKDGEISSFDTDNVYNLDEAAKDLKIEPPLPLSKYNRTERWYLRDSNWSPDFPTSANKAIWFYEQEKGPEKSFDGVIAITPTLIESLIGLTGEITIHGIKFTSDNFVEMLQYQVEKGFYQQNLELSQRKEIIGDLSKELIDKILSLPQEKWKDLLNILSKNLKEKHFLIYLKEAPLQNIISSKNWGAEIKSTSGDYLSLIDTNLASLKSDPGVKRTINYYLSRNKEGQLIANLQVIYKNEGTFTWKTTRYRTYFRLYVPAGSKLIDIMGTNEDKDIVDDLGKTYFGSFVVVEPQETVKIMFKYILPSSVQDLLDNDQYHLLVQKQPGSANYNLNISYNLPKKINKYEPIDKGTKQSNNELSFKTSLDSDQVFYIDFK